MTAIGLCACGRLAEAVCTECSRPVCQQHFPELVSPVVCRDCTDAKVQAWADYFRAQAKAVALMPPALASRPLLIVTHEGSKIKATRPSGYVGWVLSTWTTDREWDLEYHVDLLTVTGELIRYKSVNHDSGLFQVDSLTPPYLMGPIGDFYINHDHQRLIAGLKQLRES